MSVSLTAVYPDFLITQEFLSITEGSFSIFIMGEYTKLGFPIKSTMVVSSAAPVILYARYWPNLAKVFFTK